MRRSGIQWHHLNLVSVLSALFDSGVGSVRNGWHADGPNTSLPCICLFVCICVCICICICICIWILISLPNMYISPILHRSISWPITLRKCIRLSVPFPIEKILGMMKIYLPAKLEKYTFLNRSYKNQPISRLSFWNFLARNQIKF